MHRRHVLATLSLPAMLLAGCGFQLRGEEQASLPFESICIVMQPGSELTPALKRYIETRTRTRVVNDPKQAAVILDLPQRDQREKVILALNTQGLVREYTLTYHATVRLRDNQDHEWMPATPLVIKRTMSFNESQAIAKEQEEILLNADMLNDMVQQVMRRLASIRR